MSEYENEPVRGLPGSLPAGEHILWQGAPDWRTLARTAMHAHWVALYFGVLVFGRIVRGVTDGDSMTTTLSHAGLLGGTGMVAVALLTLYAWLSARTTVYTLTNRRVVLRHGVAMPKCINLPYKQVAAAGLKVDARGFGDIPVALADDSKLAYVLLWPHARPFRFTRPEPMLRAIPDAATVAQTLSVQLQAAAREADRPFVVGQPQVEAAPAAPAPAQTTVAA